MANSTTKYGIPYAEGADGLDTIDETWIAMARRLDLIAGETGSTTIQAAGAGVVTKRVNYARDYSTTYGGLGYTPRAWVQLSSGHADTILTVSAEDSTGFTLELRTALAGTLTRTVRWFCGGFK